MVARDAFPEGNGSIRLKNIPGTINRAYVLLGSLRAKKDRRICASIIWSGCQQSAGWNIEVHDSLESATGEKAGRPTEYHALIEDVSESPCRYFTCKRARALLDPGKRPISCGRHSCCLHAPRATGLAGVAAGETGNGWRRIIRGVVGTGERHRARYRVCD